MLETGILLLEIDYQDQTFYLSDTAITNENVYWPYIAEFPSFSIAGDGYARISLGSLSIIRDEKNDFHPFSGRRYQQLLTSIQEIGFRLYLNLQRTSLFEGNLALESVSETQITFSIIESEYEAYVVDNVLDEERRIGEKFFFEKTSTSYQLKCYLPNNEFTDSQEIIFETKSSGGLLSKLLYDRVEKNIFLVDQRTINTFSIVLSEDANTVIDADYLGIMTDLDGSGVMELEALSATQLSDYGLSGSNYYQLLNDEISPIMLWVGSPAQNPFAFGHVKVRDPVIKKGGTLEIIDGQIVYDSNSVAATGANADTTTVEVSNYSTVLVVEPEKDNFSVPTSISLQTESTSWFSNKRLMKFPRWYKS